MGSLLHAYPQPEGEGTNLIPISLDTAGDPVLFATPDWIGANAAVLSAITVPDASMEPLLKQGATVIIRTDLPLDDGAIVATQFKGKVGLHRYRSEPDGGSFFWHDNPAHPPISAAAGSADHHITGRVVWVVARLG